MCLSLLWVWVRVSGSLDTFEFAGRSSCGPDGPSAHLIIYGKDSIYEYKNPRRSRVEALNYKRHLSRDTAALRFL